MRSKAAFGAVSVEGDAGAKYDCGIFTDLITRRRPANDPELEVVAFRYDAVGG